MRRCFRTSLWLSHHSNYVCSSCARHLTTVPLDAASRQGTPRFTVSSHSLVLAQSTEYRQLLHLLDQPSNISSSDATWKAYSNLVRANFMDGSRIPLEIHQRALRRTLPIYTKSLGDAMSLKARKSRQTASLHGWCPYQYRIDAILEHIRACGVLPHLEEYHLILLHYAVWGNIQGSLELLHALVTSGSSPAERTYELVLYSFVRKLALVRHWEHTREDLLPLVEKEFFALLNDMKNRDIRRTRLINDHCVRIAGAVSPRQNFDSMVAAIYGIDVKQPDAVPSQMVKEFLAASKGEEGKSPNSEVETERELPPASTAILNTLVCVLGTGPDRSLAAMIGTFESLTSPIPPLRPKQEAYGYEDGVDDDEPHYIPPAPFFIRRAHPSRPNTQTYTYLIQNCLAMRNKTLAKHYLDQAINDEKSQEHLIRARIRNIMYNAVDGSVQITADSIAQLRKDVTRATVGVNAYMFKALCRYADERGDGALIRWVTERELAVIQEKKQSVALLTALSEAMDLVDAEQSSSPREGSSQQPQHRDRHNADCGVQFNHRTHLRVHTRNIADIRNHMEVASLQLRQAEAHAPKAASSVKRLREQKMRRQANSFVAKELDMDLATVKQSYSPAVARIREQYERRWAATMSARNLRKLSEETLDDIDHGIFSEPPPVNIASAEKMDDVQEALMQDHLVEAVGEFRDAATSISHQNISPATLLVALRTPLARDSQLHRYENLPAAFAAAFDVQDHHVFAPGVRKMRSKGKFSNKAMRQETSTGPNNTPEDSGSGEYVHTPFMRSHFSFSSV